MPDHRHSHRREPKAVDNHPPARVRISHTSTLSEQPFEVDLQGADTPATLA